MAILFLLKFDQPGRTVFVFLARDDWQNAFFDQILVDLLGSVPFAAGEEDRSDRLYLPVDEKIGALKQLLQALRVVPLALRQAGVQRVPV